MDSCVPGECGAAPAHAYSAPVEPDLLGRVNIYAYVIKRKYDSIPVFTRSSLDGTKLPMSS